MSRILLISDVHLCHIAWYGMPSAARMEKLLVDLEEENKHDPIDMILMLGDYSLDYWECAPYGSYSVSGISNTKAFLEKFASRFPCPFYILPGNHEQYTQEDWLRITGFKRQYSVIYRDTLFLMLDTFGTNLNATEHNHGTYSFADTDYIEAQLAHNPGKKVFLCAHDFDFIRESEKFRSLIRENNNIIALFGGHTHLSATLSMGDDYGGKSLYRTGEYSYTSAKSIDESIWGYRELVITPDRITTAYIEPSNTIITGGKSVEIEYHRQDDAVLFECK